MENDGRKWSQIHQLLKYKKMKFWRVFYTDLYQGPDSKNGDYIISSVISAQRQPENTCVCMWYNYERIQLYFKFGLLEIASRMAC